MRPVQPRRGPRQTYRQTIASRGDMTDHPLDQGDNKGEPDWKRHGARVVPCDSLGAAAARRREWMAMRDCAIRLTPPERATGH